MPANKGEKDALKKGWDDYVASVYRRQGLPPGRGPDRTLAPAFAAEIKTVWRDSGSESSSENACTLEWWECSNLDRSGTGQKAGKWEDVMKHDKAKNSPTTKPWAPGMAKQAPVVRMPDQPYVLSKPDGMKAESYCLMIEVRAYSAENCDCSTKAMTATYKFETEAPAGGQPHKVKKVDTGPRQLHYSDEVFNSVDGWSTPSSLVVKKLPKKGSLEGNPCPECMKGK